MINSRKIQISLNKALAITFCIVLLGACSARPPPPHYDLLFLNGLVVDGSGEAPYVADVAVNDNRIAAIGDLSDAQAEERIDISGLVIAPGFIDAHSHAEEALVNPALKTNKGFITQGVTTAVFGADGGYAPADLNTMKLLLEKQGAGTNFLFYAGHNGIRQAVMGMKEGAPSTAELTEMKAMVREAMLEGAIGLSSGLMYLPGSYAKTDELIELAKVTTEFDGRYDSHVRDPADNLLASIEECLITAKAAGVAAHPAHIKAVGGKNFGIARDIIQLITDQQAQGLEVTADLYPYDGAAARNLIDLLVVPADWPEAIQVELLGDPESSDEIKAQLQRELDTSLREALKDPEKRQQIKTATEQPAAGVFSWIKVVGYTSLRIVVSDTPGMNEQMVVKAAATHGKEPFDLLADLIVSEGRKPKLTLGAIQQSDVRELLVQPWVMISSDGRESGDDGPSGHPRFRGSFPRVLGRYVREWQVLSIETAIKKMTSLPARYLKLTDRGLLREGYNADITVFDPARIIDRSTWEQPWLYSEGVVHVMVNGGFALKNGQMTGQTFGHFIPYSK